MGLVVAGMEAKRIAFSTLGIGEITVAVHRGRLPNVRKMHAGSPVELGMAEKLKLPRPNSV